MLLQRIPTNEEREQTGVRAMFTYHASMMELARLLDREYSHIYVCVTPGQWPYCVERWYMWCADVVVQIIGHRRSMVDQSVYR